MDYWTHPYDHPDKVYFHSLFNYMNIKQSFVANLTLPQRDPTGATYSNKTGQQWAFQQGVAYYVIGTHTMGVQPYAVWTEGASSLPTNFYSQVTGVSTRLLALVVTSDTVMVRETYTVHSQALSASTKTIAIHLLGTAGAVSNNTLLDITPTRVTAGGGKLDSDYGYIRKNPTTPLMALVTGRTMDASGGGTRYVNPDGSYAQDSSYNGSFSAVNHIGVSI